MKLNRRKFISGGILGATMAVNIPNIVSAALSGRTAQRKIDLNKDDIILFQGDSITDAGRTRDIAESNNIQALGNGYTLLASADLLHRYPQHSLTLYNRGISGNKVHQLTERWDTDCLQLKPNVLSILIGVNDYWHTLTGGYNGDLQVYTDDYRKLLDRTLQSYPHIKLIIGEPFAVNHVKAVTDDWYPAFDGYRLAAQNIAQEYQAVFIPYQQIFDEACEVVAPHYWTSDGVHTTLAGAQLMASAWLNAIT